MSGAIGGMGGTSIPGADSDWLDCAAWGCVTNSSGLGSSISNRAVGWSGTMWQLTLKSKIGLWRTDTVVSLLSRVLLRVLLIQKTRSAGVLSIADRPVHDSCVS